MGYTSEEEEGETAKQRAKRLRKKKREEKEDPFGKCGEESLDIYAGTIDAPDTSPRWRRAAILFRTGDDIEHPNDDDTNKLFCFYGYSKSRSRVTAHILQLLHSMAVEELPVSGQIMRMGDHLPELVADKGCQALALVGYYSGDALKPPPSVSMYLEKQVSGLTAVSTGVPERCDVYSALSVALVGDASLTHTLVAHTGCQIVDNMVHYCEWSLERKYNVHEPLYALKDAVSPNDWKYLSPVTLQALADVLSCQISCLAGGPTLAQADAYCAQVRHVFVPTKGVVGREKDIRPSELAIMAFHDHKGSLSEETLRCVKYPFQCYALVPNELKTLLNPKLLDTKAFLPQQRGRMPGRVLGDQLLEESRALRAIGAYGRPHRHVPIATCNQREPDNGSMAGTAHGGGGEEDAEEDSGVRGTEVTGRRSGVVEDAVQEGGSVQLAGPPAVDDAEEPFDEPYWFDPEWKKERYLEFIPMRDLFLRFLEDESAQVLETKPTNPRPGGVYFCRRTQSISGIDELPENLGAWTNAQGKGTRHNLRKFVDRTTANVTMWVGMHPPHLPVATYQQYRDGDESRFTAEEARGRFFQMKRITASHLNRSGKALKVAAFV